MNLFRPFPMAAALAAVLLAGPAMANETVIVSLDWTPNTNHVGLYVAQAQGFYEEGGLDVEIVPSAQADVADFQVRSVLTLFTRRAAGDDFVGVLAVNQRETGRLVYRGDRADISRPRDLEGLVYGGFGTAWEDVLVETMIAHDGGAPDYETVILHSSVYEALDAGEVDFTLDIYTWEGVLKELEGREYGAFAYADHGVPDQHTIIILSTGDYLGADPERASAFVSATRRGYEYALENPGEAAEILLAAAPELGGEADLVHASLQAIVAGDFMATPEGEVGAFDPGLMDALGAFLFDADALHDAQGEPLASVPDFSAYYTNGYLD